MVFYCNTHIPKNNKIYYFIIGNLIKVPLKSEIISPLLHFLTMLISAAMHSNSAHIT